MDDKEAFENLEKVFAYNKKIRGHIIELDDMRLVFLGKHENDPNTWHIGFRNAQGEDTRFALSREALGALTNLFNRPRKSEPVSFPMVVNTTWKVVMVKNIHKNPDPSDTAVG